MVSQPSCFDAKAYPVVSFVWNSLVIALGLLPLAIGFDVYTIFNNAAEIGAEYDFPESWPWYIAGAFVFCLCCAALLVSAYRLLAWHFRKGYCRVNE